ncbi:hypothetical protein PMAYCL1PPCAC_03893 [Pristionchus mayeri]|uniref:Uncharacterized protein n=1 Tax=Pristionchus mayeri TaxID=1317129 RepID=A0AAN4Z3T7_9BILA|nr:hypothetical protein PMAYCL1PPCAC_03893 [Pristionchus mayeri]
MMLLQVLLLAGCTLNVLGGKLLDEWEKARGTLNDYEEIAIDRFPKATLAKHSTKYVTSNYTTAIMLAAGGVFVVIASVVYAHLRPSRKHRFSIDDRQLVDTM